jgi:chitinase
MNLAKAKHIPLLFFGNALNSVFRGYRCSKIGNQNDIAATLLSQLNLISDRYVWSKNLLNPGTNDFAYYSNETVLGWISKSDSIAYSYVEKKNIVNNRFSKINELNAKAYLQQLYATFNSY